MYQNLFDSHTHSENSLDGHHSVTFMAEAALERNVQGFAVTDHCDCDLMEENHNETRMRQCALDVAVARAAFRNRVIITHGIELGQPHLNYEAAEKILSEQHFDFVLLSLHTMRGWKDFYDVDYSALTGPDLADMMGKYFTELLETVKWGNFDSLAHMSLPLRYLKKYRNIEIDLSLFFEPIDSILRVLIETGKALEINTSGLRGALRDSLPPFWVIGRYRELGGELVTIGSDAHRADDIGRNIRDGMHLLLELGFDYFTFYRDRTPVMLRII